MMLLVFKERQRISSKDGYGHEREVISPAFIIIHYRDGDRTGYAW